MILKAITFNMCHGEGIDGSIDVRRQAMLLKKYKPDIIFLQEIDIYTKRAYNKNQIYTFSKYTGLPYRVMGTNINYPFVQTLDNDYYLNRSYDKTYNNVRVLAADKSLPFGTIIKVSNLKDYNDFIGIVLDRGSAISFDGFSQIDLLFESEDYSYNFGRKENVIFEILRLGY